MTGIRTAARACAAIALATTALLFVAPGNAQERASPLPSHLPLGKEACFGRDYDAAHLASHPKQRVTSFYLFRDFSPDTSAEAPPLSRDELIAADGSDGNVGVTAYVRFRDRQGLFWNSLSCRRSDDGTVRCGVDCDGGGFKLRAEDQSLLVENEGFVVVGGCGASEDEREREDVVKPGADDRVFRLDSKPVAACAAVRDAHVPAWAKLGPPLRERLATEQARCFARAYDNAHLARHPQQTVRRIAVLKQEGAKPENPDWPTYELTFQVELKNGRKIEKKTTCAPDSYAYACANDVRSETQRDFYLTRAGQDHLMLRDRRGALTQLFGVSLGTDDRLFRLQASPASACGL